MLFGLNPLTWWATRSSGNPLFDVAITVNVEMPAVAGLALRVKYFFTPDPCHRQVGQFGAMDNKQIDAVGITAFQPICIRQEVLVDFRVYFSSGAGARCVAMIQVNKKIGGGNGPGMTFMADKLLAIFAL